MNDDQMKLFGSCPVAVFLAFIFLLYTGVSDIYAQQKDLNTADISGRTLTSEIKQVDLTTVEITPQTAIKFESVDIKIDGWARVTAADRAANKSYAPQDIVIIYRQVTKQADIYYAPLK